MWIRRNGELRVQPWGSLTFEGRGADGDGEKMVERENYVIEPRRRESFRKEAKTSDATQKTNRMSTRKSHWNEQLGNPTS